jgi:transcriptional regulator with XRE-family HTH domain
MHEPTGDAINILLGKNLRRLRARKNISQLALANQAGLTHNFINEIENGRKWVSPESLAKLAGALDAEPYQFFSPETELKPLDPDIVTEHLEDITDSFNKWVRDIRVRYLGEDDEEPGPKPGKRRGKD